MNLQEFRALQEVEKIKLINDRLQQLKKEGKTTKEFRNTTLDFTYSSVIKEMQKLGYARDGEKFAKEVKLSEHDILLLKNLAYSYNFIMQEEQDQPKVVKRTDDKAVTTSARVYNKVWKRWQSFCQEWGIYNGVDLMASAMEEFMDKHYFEDYETLVKQGKIK